MIPPEVKPMQIYFEDILIQYTKYGNGSKVVIAFHGFGQEGSIFKQYAEKLSAEYSLYAFDLFFHGGSRWPSNKDALSKDKWKEIFQVFLQKEEISSFSLIGYSIGAKPVLALLTTFSAKIRSISLIAPDGVKQNFWYTLATSSTPSRALFKQLLEKPALFLKTVHFLGESGYLKKGLARFVLRQMKTKQQRYQIYSTWIIYRQLRFDLDALASILNDTKIPISVYLGKEDQIITESSMKGLLRRLHYCRLHFLPATHSQVLFAFFNYNN